ncbi:MAG: hypothetical protein Unbinned92contig1002_10 [Prokaryotic dsDNA virus sp.]|nr:MAG: hypothetical protein Unbinned92contig1002_10 [Prokaryotic dsDNA virus sp.]|tara:strand:- start:25790 stop:26035 length:246 start_codon:yes stop_codon:yes gene_type:complete
MQQTINEYYALSLYELENGVTIHELQLMLNQYKDMELYLACEGIHRAIEHYKFLVLYHLIIYYTFDDDLKEIPWTQKRYIN